MFREENVSTSFQEARELGDFSGINPIKVVAFRAERLIVHELLVRVTADFSIDTGSVYADLGINFRKACSRILDRYIMPDVDKFINYHEELRRNVEKRLAAELTRQFPIAPRDDSRKLKQKALYKFFSWLKSSGKREKVHVAPQQRERIALESWQEQSRASDDQFEKSCLDALFWVVSTIAGHRGGLIGDHSIIIKLAANRVCNVYGSEQIGLAIDPYLEEAVKQGEYRRLPSQPKPVVMNAKGASAAGKSSIRQQQKLLSQRLGVEWHDFAVISPDIWRKFLLDYNTLGSAYKYAGMLSGHELEIIDEKLDRYMAAKAASGKMSHLLIDRFRFDSFAASGELAQDSKLLTRFGDLIFMFFMITPPDATVERAWHRGLETGRYKAVDDLLYHNVEAFTGMPQLFFKWAGVSDKKVHYEFLDNSVAKGKLPRTVAFGWNGTMIILDIKCLLDIDRYTKINIDAKQSDDVYVTQDMRAECNTVFFQQCAHSIPKIIFVDKHTAKVYGRMEHGNWVWRDVEYVSGMSEAAEERIALEAVGWSKADSVVASGRELENLEHEKAHTLGEW